MQNTIWARVFLILAAIPMVFIFGSYIFATNPTYFLLLVLILGSGIFYFYKKKSCNKYFAMKKHNYKLYFWIAFTMYIILQLVVGTRITVNPAWDFGTLYYNAQAYVINGAFEAPQTIARFPHNDLLLLVYIVYFRMLTFLHIPISVNAVLGLNIVFIDVAIFFVYKSANALWNEKIAFFVALACFAFLPLLAYAPILYTDTASLPFVAIILWLQALIAKKKYTVYSKKWFICMALQGVFLAIGYLFKATVVIIGVAIAVVILFQPKSIYNWKSKLIRIISTFLAFVLVVTLSQAIFTQVNLTSKESEEAYSFPATHWLMMGLVGNGGYNQEDADFTMSFPTKEAKKEANILEIKERLSSMGFIGYVSLLNRKAVYTWADGTYYSSAKLAVTPLHEGTFAQIFRLDGKYNFLYQAYANFYQTILLFGLAMAYLKKLMKPKFDYWTILLFAISGLAIFLFLWEDRSRYLLNFFPLLVLASLYGYKNFFAASNSILEKRKTNINEKSS